MLHRPLLALALVLAPAALHALRYSPADGTVLARSYSWEETSRTESVESLLDGQPAGEVPNLSYDLVRRLELGVTDTVEKVGDGRPDRFVRRYGDLFTELQADLTLDFGGQEVALEMAGDGTSPLEGLDVRFTWSDAAGDDGGWRAAWAEEGKGGPDALLEGLGADLDFLGLLPPGPVDLDERWEVDLAAAVRALFPAGDVGLRLETDLDRLEGALDPADMPTVAEVLAEADLEGEATCRLVGVTGEVAEVELSVELRGEASFVERLDALAGDAAPEGVDVTVTAALFRAELRGEGRLSFALVKGYVTAFAFEGETGLDAELHASVDADGETLEYEQRHERVGTLKIACTVE